MPELPEIETIKRSLQANLGAKIKKTDVFREDIIRQKDYELLLLAEKTIKKIDRRGKYLAIVMESGFNIILHLGMSGRFYMLKEGSAVTDKHVHLIIYLDNGKKLIFQDTRRFGGVWFVDNLQKVLCNLGIEPLAKEFTKEYLAEITQNRKIAIKGLILNQKLVCGIGNIYADEALFEARIRPQKPAGSLSADEIADLHVAIKKVLKKGIKKRGTTFRDYRDGLNQAGEFQHHLRVYGKNDQDCPICGAKIKKVRITGRSSHFCANCQK